MTQKSNCRVEEVGEGFGGGGGREGEENFRGSGPGGGWGGEVGRERGGRGKEVRGAGRRKEVGGRRGRGWKGEATQKRTVGAPGTSESAKVFCFSGSKTAQNSFFFFGFAPTVTFSLSFSLSPFQPLSATRPPPLTSIRGERAGGGEATQKRTVGAPGTSESAKVFFFWIQNRAIFFF